MGKPRKPPQAKRQPWYSSIVGFFDFGGGGGTSEASVKDGVKGKVNLLDGAALKRALDDAAAEVVVEAGYPEDTRVGNIKLGLGAATCFCALLAQFYPKKFPDNWWLLFCCVIAYGIFSTVLNLFINNVEGDAFLITKPKNGVALRVASHFPRYTTAYTLIISKDTGRHQPKGTRETVTLPTHVTSYFDEDGYLAHHIFRKDVLGLLHKFEEEIEKPHLDSKKSL